MDGFVQETAIFETTRRGQHLPTTRRVVNAVKNVFGSRPSEIMWHVMLKTTCDRRIYYQRIRQYEHVMFQDAQQEAFRSARVVFPVFEPSVNIELASCIFSSLNVFYHYRPLLVHEGWCTLVSQFPLSCACFFSPSSLLCERFSTASLAPQSRGLGIRP